MSKKIKNIYREWVLPTIVFFAIMMLIRQFIFEPTRVRGLSMFPTLSGDEFVIINKALYKLGNPKYGDVVVFHTAEKKDYIKRIIGLPGDRIVIKEGRVYRNGKELDEGYANQPTIGSRREVVVPSGQIYVLGDNRLNSKDSRVIGTIHLDEVVGRAEIVVFPFNEMKMLHP